jgi:hypothetical protein
MLPQTTQSIGSRPYCAEQDSVRFSQRREPLRWKHLAELPGRQRRQLLCDRAKLHLSSAGGNFGQMCQNSKGQCCTPNAGDVCQ